MAPSQCDAVHCASLASYENSVLMRTPPATGLAAFTMYQRLQQQFTVGAQQCLPVTAAFAFMRVAGGPHSAMHVSAVTFTLCSCYNFQKRQ
jgi:hypothetical protein